MFDQNTKILVIDDMTTMRTIMRKFLGELGFIDLLEASDGAEGWDRITRGPGIELVISGWYMPKSTGLDLLSRVRADSRFKTLPFLLVTDDSMLTNARAALEAGVDGFVLKPFAKETLRLKLGEMHARRAARSRWVG